MIYPIPSPSHLNEVIKSLPFQIGKKRKEESWYIVPEKKKKPQSEIHEEPQEDMEKDGKEEANDESEVDVAEDTPSNDDTKKIFCRKVGATTYVKEWKENYIY